MTSAQIELLNEKIKSLNEAKATLVLASASTTEVDGLITDATNLLTTFNQQLEREQDLAQNNIDALSIKNDLIKNLGSEFQLAIMNSVVCAKTRDNCQCMGCKYAYYSKNGLSNEQIKMFF